MLKWVTGLALLALACLPLSAAAQSTMGYDAFGRLVCVYHATTQPKITRYTYDEAGNRSVKSITLANGQTCGSQPVGTPPSLPVSLTATSPSASLVSEASQTFAMTSLGSASDAATLSLVSATTSGGAGACGTASTTSSLLSYTAPVVNPATASLTCYIDYTFSHPGGQQKTGRVTATVQGVDPPEGGGGGEGPCIPNPRTGICEIE